jgi:LPS sulfotransferase NodH
VPLPAHATYAPYLFRLKEAGTTSNGVFGIKVHYYQFEGLPAKLSTVPAYRDLPRSQLLSTPFPEIKHIWLSRRDKVRQAVSYHKACQTDGWWVKETHGPPIRPGAMKESVFDPHNIERLEKVLQNNEAGWQRYFEESGTKPLVVMYEDLAADYDGTIRMVLNWLGVPGVGSVEIPPPKLKKQADSTSEEWAQRYLEFKRGVRSAPSAGISAPLAPASVPDRWKRWIGENKLVKTSDAVVVETLVRNGIPREAASAEVQRANSEPYLQAGDWMAQRLRKVESLLATYRALAQLHPSAGVVERRSSVDREEFLERYYAANRPVILQGLMRNWKAMSVWTPEYLKASLGSEEVEIMAGRNADPSYEINAFEHKRKVRFGEFVDMVHTGGPTNDYYLVANNAFFKRPAVRRLLEDVEIFPEYLSPRGTENQVFFWYGPADTVTPLHHDTSNIFMAQVWGRKRIKLISPNDHEFIYNDIGVFSHVDCDNPDLARFPLFKGATVIEVVLEPEEVLFLPVGWWHHVRALDISLTVTFTNFAFPNHFEWRMPQIRK